MNRFLTVVSQIMLLMGLVLMYGCINVEYVGQSFPVLAENEPVKIYWPTVQPPEDTYRAIGRVFIEAPDGTTQGDIAEELITLARKHGAEAVNILEYKRIKIGSAEVGSDRTLRVGWNRDNRNAGGSYIYSNYFGQTITMGNDYTSVTELQIKAVLLVTEKKFRDLESRNKPQKNAEFAGSTGKKSVQTAEAALDKSVKPVEASPVKPYKSDPPAERKPSRLELSADHRPAVDL